MLIFYQKYYVHINLLLVLLLGLACGLLGGAWFNSSINWEKSDIGRPIPQQHEKIKTFTPTDLNLILQHNLFDPSGRSNSATVDLGGEETFPLNGSDNGIRKSPASKRVLLGTVSAGKNSLALMQVDGQFTIYHLQEELPDGGTIENIFRNHIQIREQNKSLTDVIINEEDKVNTKPSKADYSSENKEIKQVDERHWVIPQRTAEETRQKLPAELRLAQLQPRITNGKTDGFIIRRLKRASILNKLGLKRGDVILNINDITLDGPESGLQVFQQLREARQIDLAVERKGKAMTFTYELN